MKYTLTQLRKLKRVPATRKFIGETVDQMRERLTNWADNYGCKGELIEHEGRFELRGQFVMKPPIQEDIKGHVVFRSKDYYFEYDGIKSYGDIKADQLTDYGFYLKTFNNEEIQYHLEI